MEFAFVKKSPKTVFERFRIEAGRSGFVTVRKAAAIGISRKLLSNWAKVGKIQRVACGLYQLPSEVPDEMELLAKRSRKLAFSHESALFLNGLAERCPVAYSVTIPSAATLPRFSGAPLKAYYVKDALFGIGLEKRRTPTGSLVPCYNAERTICDILRSRSRVDEETIVAALRLFAALPSKDLNRLADYARLFRVERLAHERLEVLL